MRYAILGGRQILRATGLVMMGIVASNATGFLREIVIANYFGATRLTNVYLLAFTIPEFLFTLLSVVIGATLVPLLTRYYLRGEREAWSFRHCSVLVLGTSLPKRPSHLRGSSSAPNGVAGGGIDMLKAAVDMVALSDLRYQPLGFLFYDRVDAASDHCQRSQHQRLYSVHSPIVPSAEEIVLEQAA